jgi:uncharacterized membrane protein
MYEPHSSFQRSPINIGADERSFSMVSGLGIIALSLTRRGALSVPAFLVGLALLYRGLTGNSSLYDRLNKNTAVKTNEAQVSVPHKQGFHVRRAVTIKRPVEDLYNFWRDLTNLPQVITYIESIEVTGSDRTHWTIKLPGGAKAEFDVEVYTDTPNEVISWRSLPESSIQNAGSIRFRPAPADRGTEVLLTIEFVPPAGPLGQAILKLFGDVPAQYIGQYLRDFKQMMETGEKATTEGQTSGRKQEAKP